MTRIEKKLKSRNGSIRTILTSVVIFLPLLFLFLVIGAWKLNDVQYSRIDSYVEQSVDMITKTGVIHTAIDYKLNANIRKILGDDYTIEYFEIDYDTLRPHLDNPGSTDYPNPVPSSVGRQFRTSDLVYIQVKSEKEALYSKLINAFSSSNDNQYKLLIVHEGMVETNAY